MKTWICRISVALNVLVLLTALGAWFNRDYFVRGFLDAVYTARVSFFSSYPPPGDSIVMLGDSITEGGEWVELFPGTPVRNRGIGGDTTTGLLARLAQVTGGEPAITTLKASIRSR